MYKKLQNYTGQGVIDINKFQKQNKLIEQSYQLPSRLETIDPS